MQQHRLVPSPCGAETTDAGGGDGDGWHAQERRNVTVAVLIVNWNGGALLEQCLASLQSQQRRPDHIVVVDNASTDNSLQLAEARLRDTQLIRLASNVGFARANNIAARA